MARIFLGAWILAVASPAFAGPRVAIDDDDDEVDVTPDTKSGEQVVILNASSRLGNTGRMTRVKRVLESRNMLVDLPTNVENALAGANVLVGDVDEIRNAYLNFDFEHALDLVRTDETRILRNVSGGDPVPALAELAQWRGFIAAGKDDHRDAVRWFRAAVRLNPAWTPDKGLTSPQIRPLVKRAREEVDEHGRLAVSVEPADARVRIDDGRPRRAHGKIKLRTGYHLVTISAHKHASYAEMVDIKPGKVYRLEIALERESRSDKLGRLIERAVAAPAGKARLRRTRSLSKYANGATHFLVIEDGSHDEFTMRVYDVKRKKVSKPLDFDNQAAATTIARKVVAALDPDTMMSPNSIMVVERQHHQRWYERWYVWVGVAALAGGSYFGYRYMTREPTVVRF